MVDPEIFSDVQAVSPFDFSQTNSLSAEGISVEQQPYCIKLGLRGNQNDPVFVKSVEEFCGFALPMIPNTAHHSDTSSLFWLGPDEWQWRLNATHDETAEALVLRIRDALSSFSSSVVDVSDYYSVIRLEGTRVYDVVAKGSPLDARKTLAAPGMCAQTRFGHASVFLNRRDNTASSISIDVQVRWSFAEYLWLFFSESILEYQK